MELKTFLSLVTKLKEIPLPGFKSHLLLAPLDRYADLNNTNYNNINGTGNNEVQALSWNFHTRNGNVTANTAFGDASRATAIGCVLTLGGGSSSTLPNRFQGLYISNGMIVHDLSLIHI